MTMGEYIKYLRTERNLSQEELGKMVGVQRAAVQKWENGHVENIKRSTIKKLSAIFNVSPCDLMKWDEETQTISSIETKYNKTVTEALNLFQQLDDFDQERIIERMETMLESEKYMSKDTPKIG